MAIAGNRYLILWSLLGAAGLSYAVGFTVGVGVLVAFGVIFELGFWFQLFARQRRR